MNGIRTLPDCQMPVFTDMFLHGIKNVYLLGYCGSLEKSTAIGTLVIPHDFLDCTRNRRRSFIEAIAPGTLFFYRMSNPYSPGLQRLLLRAAETQGLRCQDIDIYAVTEGPRFETRAEVQALATLGAQAVCFSGVPDASFARELNMNFACAFFVSNYGEGMPGGAFETILHTAAEQSTAISRLVVTLVRRDVATAIDPGFHDQYWMQRPPQEVFDDIY
jgi:purine nucleoside phosphorylase